MTYEEINSMIESMGVDFAYYQFPVGTEIAPPFICFYFTDDNSIVADNINYQKILALRIEVYTSEKDFALEDIVEAKLTENELPFAHYESYIDTEKLIMQTYETEVLING